MLTDKARPALLQARRVLVRPDRALRCTGSGTSNCPSARRVCVRLPRGVRLFQKGPQLFQNSYPPRPISASYREPAPASDLREPTLRVDPTVRQYRGWFRQETAPILGRAAAVRGFLWRGIPRMPG